MSSDLLHLHAVGEHQVDLRFELELHADAAVLDAYQRQGAGFLDQLGDAFHAPLAFAARDEIAQPADDLPGAHGLVGGLVQGVAHGRGFFVTGALQAAGVSPAGSWRSPTAAD